MSVKVQSEEFELVELFGKQALYTSSRIDRSTVPDGVYAYDLRHGDTLDPVTVEEYMVVVNHAGTVVMTEPLDFSKAIHENGFVYFSIRDSLNFLDEYRMFSDFITDQDEARAQRDLNPRAVPAEESALFFLSEGKESDMGCIGYVRGDFGGSGKQFWTTWFECCADLKTQEFRDELDLVINRLRDGGMLKDLPTMARYCHEHPESKLDLKYRNDTYGFKISTESHSYYIRGLLTQGDYNLYCMCYNRGKLEEYLGAANQGQTENQVDGITMGGM